MKRQHIIQRFLLGILLSTTAIAASAQDDWGNFRKYEASNQEILAQPNNGKRVVFLGNSITENWGKMRGSFFSDNGYICRGISGQTSYQFVLRMREDVVNLKPKVVVINAGTNDIAQNNHRYVEDRTFGNIVTLCEIAKANKIKVILTPVTPCNHYPWRPEIKDVAKKIISLNARIKEYAKRNKITYVDYFTPMAEADGSMQTRLTNDGCHPTESGYEIMEKLIKEAIQKYVK